MPSLSSIVIPPEGGTHSSGGYMAACILSICSMSGISGMGPALWRDDDGNGMPASPDVIDAASLGA